MSGVFEKVGQMTYAKIKRRRDFSVKPFIRKYNQPVLVHAVNNSRSFLKILKEGKLKIPRKHDGSKKCPYMEKILGIDNSIFFSLGFVYWATYDFKYNLIFDLDLLGEAIYYKKQVVFKSYKAIANYLYDHDRDYLVKMSGCNKKCREVIEKYVHQKEAGSKKFGLEFWKAEEELYNFIMRYPKKKVLIKIVKDTEKSLRVKFPYSKRSAKRDYSGFKFPEIISKKSIDLLKSPYFLGFYIDGKVSGEIEVAMKKYKGKFLFDGKRIEVINGKR